MTNQAKLLVAAVISLLLAHPTAASGQEPVGGSYRLERGDQVVLRVWPDSTLGGVFSVEDSGLVHVPLLGAIPASGRTVAELREALRVGYSEDLQLPIVTLEVRFRVGLLGALRSPGVFWVEPTYGVFEAIAEAGGLADNADLESIYLLRAGGERIDIGGSFQEELRGDVGLASGDRIVVPTQRSFNWGIFLQVLTLAASITSIVVR